MEGIYVYKQVKVYKPSLHSNKFLFLKKKDLIHIEIHHHFTKPSKANLTNLLGIIIIYSNESYLSYQTVTEP